MSIFFIRNGNVYLRLLDGLLSNCLDETARLVKLPLSAMALIKCGNCGAEVDTISASCQKCGTPVSEGGLDSRSPLPAAKPAGRTWVWIAVCILLLALVGAWVAKRQLGVGQAGAPAARPVEPVDVEAIKARAEKGEAEAQKTLGTLHSKGQGVPQSYIEAAKWYRKAADQGYAPAQVALGELHEAGQGVPIDDAASAKLYRQAADQGYAPGQYNLAVLYVLGKGVPQDNNEAVKWYRLAAEQGDALAQFNLGMRYYESRGVAPDPVQAFQWLTLAAAQGIPDAVNALDNLKRTMTRPQIAEGRRRAEAFVAKPTAAPAR
jgi:uncharacterized protein